MVHITFDYEPETKSVTNIVVTDLVISTTKKQLAKKASVQVEAIQLQGTSLKLTPKSMELLNVNVGDRLCVRFNGQPILATPESLGESGGGNLITKSLTVACKGKVGETLASYGSEFSYSLDSPGYLKLVGNNSTPTKQTESLEEIKSEVVDSVEFSLSVEDGEEIQFDFGI